MPCYTGATTSASTPGATASTGGVPVMSCCTGGSNSTANEADGVPPCSQPSSHIPHTVSKAFNVTSAFKNTTTPQHTAKAPVCAKIGNSLHVVLQTES